MAVRFTILLLALCGFVSSAEDLPFSGSIWRLNTDRSNGPVPSCLGLKDGTMRLPTRMFTGSPTDRPVQPLPAACALVYKFTWSPDGRTMTLTQPQLDPSFRAVFDRQ